MAEYRRYPSPLRQTTSALTVKIALLATLAALAIGGLIAVQMASGDDPALGPKAAAKAKKASTSGTETGSSSSSGYSYYGDSSGYSGDSSGYSSGSSGNSSGSSGYSYSPPPVTSSTS